MRKIFISADIEGTAGILSVDETDPCATKGYDVFAAQMTREVSAACEGAFAAGAREILIKDGHWSGRNLQLDQLPEYARVFRGWSGHPFGMMTGLDKTFDGVLFTGYHSGAGTDTLPLSHTMNGGNNYVTINGKPASELYINLLTCAYVGVPALFVSGDKGICEQARELLPGIQTVETMEGIGAGVCTIHPNLAAQRIREEVSLCGEKERAESETLTLPVRFDVEVSFKDHSKAYRGSFYPGAKKSGARALSFTSDSWWDTLCFLIFVL